MTQKELFKMIDSLASGKFTSEGELLEYLVKSVVDKDELSIKGGRIWEINPTERVYYLKFQYGELNHIPENYKVTIEDHPEFSELYKKRTLLNYETDKLLQHLGIKLYAMTGVGEMVRVGGKKYYQYLMGFNAPDIIAPFSELLNIIGSAASSVIREMEAKAAQAKISKDLQKASDIQRNLLPDHKLDFHDYDIFGVCVPDSVVGGDFFDYVLHTDEEDERLSVIISDAASKGLPAAIQALFTFGALRMGLSFPTKISTILSRLNNQIFETFDYERFVTLFYLELTLASNRLALFANAGHPSPVVYKAETRETMLLPPTGGILGLIKDQKFKIENFTISPGDIIVLYTDGISEALNSERELFGEERICDLVKEYANENSEFIAYMILEEAVKFNANSVYTDDKTIVVIKRAETRATSDYI